jgi:hypothetical protein
VPEERGIIPRAAEHIFSALQGENYIESSCTVSYLEIYNEVLNDLLAPSDKPAAKLAVADSSGPKGKGVHCAGLLEIVVKTPEDVLHLLRDAQGARATTSSGLDCSALLEAADAVRRARGWLQTVARLERPR